MPERIREDSHQIGLTIGNEPRCSCGGILVITHGKKIWKCEGCGKFISRIKKKDSKEKPLFKWSPKIEDTPDRKTDKNLLVHAYNRLQRLYPSIKLLNKLSDKYGVFALDTNYGLLVAKSYIWGSYISCHHRGLISCINQNKSLIMFIGDAEKFYKFDPKEVLKKSEFNFRGDVKMANFPIKLGSRYC